MYTKESRDEQLNLFSDQLLAPFLDSENELFKITKALDWVKLSDKLSEFYSPDNGRPTKPSRLKIGLLILKHLYKLSDKDTLRTLKENIYAQYLCNISLEGTKHCLHSSTLTYFRKQIGLKGIKFIEAEVLDSLKRAIENKGKSSYLQGKPFRERLRRLRCSIEARISLSKRRYGLDRIRYTMAQGEEMWVRLGLIAMNLKTSFGYGQGLTDF